MSHQARLQAPYSSCKRRMLLSSSCRYLVFQSRRRVLVGAAGAGGVPPAAGVTSKQQQQLSSTLTPRRRSHKATSSTSNPSHTLLTTGATPPAPAPKAPAASPAAPARLASPASAGLAPVSAPAAMKRSRDATVPAAAAAAAARSKGTAAATVCALGWTCVPPGLIYRDFASQPSDKIAAFDMDGTLLTTRSGARFARGAGDWQFLTPQVPAVLQQLVQDGYRIVVFSNQGGVRSALTGKAAATSKGKIEALLKQAGVPALVVFATMKDQYRKPTAGMWHLLCSQLNGGLKPDLSQSFYVGDAAGRPTDFIDNATGMPSDVDRQFARNAQLEFKLPEELFGQ